MKNLPPCPIRTLESTYVDGDNYVCPDCAHEWPAQAATANSDDTGGVIRDAKGNPLADGDAVILINDLTVKGSSTVLKKSSKVKSIKLAGSDHKVDCRMDSGSFMLKACFLKKAQEIRP